MSTAPKVSVIIPSYNHKPFIGLLIESIFNQTYKDFELIVLDDGSKDGSPEYLTQLKGKYDFNLVIKANEGLCKTLNKGITLARGEYIVMIGSDDIFTKERLQEQVEYLEQHKEVDIIGGCLKLMDELGKPCGEKVPAIVGNITFDNMVVINRVFAPAVMIRASVFERFGLYPENYLFEDYYLWLKVLSNGGVIHNVKKFWAYYRINNQNLEKKFNWYFEGGAQALSSYQSLPIVSKQLSRNLLVYCVKLALLLGKDFRRKYQNEYLRLPLFGKFISIAVSILPYYLRELTLRKLKIKV
jgi:alpha-1,3-rhamnosyltransferase